MTDEPTQQEKLGALRNDTNFSWQQNTVDDVGGRYSKVTPTSLTGSDASPQMPKLPASSPWSDPANWGPPEPSLGFSIDEMQPTGTPAEVEKSLSRKPEE